MSSSFRGAEPLRAFASFADSKHDDGVACGKE